MTRSDRLGRLLGQGRKSEVYEWGDSSVIKLFFPQVDAQAIAADYEASVLAGNLHLPCPRVPDRTTVDGRQGIVFERVNGLPLLGAVLAGAGDPVQMSQDFATTQAAINRAQVEQLPEYRSVLRALLQEAPAAWFSEREKQRLADHIGQLPPGTNLCHMDYHPDNVLVEGDELKVIDWALAMKGPPAFDFAYTCLILSLGDLPPGLTAEQTRHLSEMRSQFFEQYVAAYTGASGLSLADTEAFALSSRLFRLLYWRLEAEEENLKQSICQQLRQTG